MIAALKFRIHLFICWMFGHRPIPVLLNRRSRKWIAGLYHLRVKRVPAGSMLPVGPCRRCRQIPNLGWDRL